MWEKRSPRSHDPVGNTFRVHDHGDPDAVVLDEPRRLLWSAIPEDDEFGACFMDARDVVAELRDLLLAEESAEVADHREDDRALGPK